MLSEIEQIIEGFNQPTYRGTQINGVRVRASARPIAMPLWGGRGKGRVTIICDNVRHVRRRHAYGAANCLRSRSVAKGRRRSLSRACGMVTGSGQQMSAAKSSA